MAIARMQYRDHGFATITSIGGVIEVSAPTWRAKRWAIKQLKRKAAVYHIPLKRKNGAWYADPQKMRESEYKLFESLEECWVSPTDRDLRKSITKKTILDF